MMLDMFLQYTAAILNATLKDAMLLIAMMLNVILLYATERKDAD
jgi:hypothetical protein